MHRETNDPSITLKPSVEKAYSKTPSCHTCRKHYADYPAKRQARSSRFTTSKLPAEIRHMGFRPKPFSLC